MNIGDETLIQKGVLSPLPRHRRLYSVLYRTSVIRGSVGERVREGIILRGNIKGIGDQQTSTVTYEPPPFHYT